MSVDDTGSLLEVPDTAAGAVSDTGSVVAYETIVSPPGPAEAGDPTDVLSTSRRVWVRDRVGNTSRPVAEPGSVAPGISGDGCIVAYTVVGSDDVDATLTFVDRCAATADLPLPLGAVIDTVGLDPVRPLIAASDPAAVDAPEGGAGVPTPTPRVGTAALSFDGATIVWSTGREIRRYEREAPDQPYVLTHAFDATAAASADVVTGAAVDVSADGRTVVFVAGPGTAAFEPTPSNVYVWSLATPPAEPELLSPTATGDPSTGRSAWPTISADGTFVVFESTDTDLAVVGAAPLLTPYVVGVDRSARTAQVLLENGARPALSADGNHIAYQRGDAIRLLSSGADSVVDTELAELVAARPTGPIAISQYGRWLVFPSAERLDPAAAVDPGSPTALWAADRTASNPDVVDTTTTTTVAPVTTPPPTAPPAPTTPTTVPPVPTSTVVAGTPTVPATTLAPAPVVPRFPTSGSPFPRVPYPSAPRSPASSVFPGASSSVNTFVAGSVTANPPSITFERTVVAVGRRTLPVALINSTPDTVGVTASSVTPAGAFSIASDGCLGLRLAPGASCTIDVQFAPTEVGVVSAMATFQLDDGTVATVLLGGEGVPDPSLDLVPAVAGAGQTVTVFGAGFPPGSTIELTQPGVASPHAILVGADGTFAHVAVVLPNTPTGPVVFSVAGQPDAFGDLDTELLVSSRGTTSGNAALRNSVGSTTSR